MKFIKKHKEILILVILGIIFFFIYSWFDISTINSCLFASDPNNSRGSQISDYSRPIKFSSPDETANYFWIKNFAQGKIFMYEEPLNTIANNLIHPRSMNVAGGYVVPGSFLGIILIYGLIAKIFGPSIILYLTPFFAVIGVIFFYKLMALIFNKQISFVSSILLFFTPSWWYYTSRGMYHNVLFLVLLIIGLYLLIMSLKLKISAEGGSASGGKNEKPVPSIVEGLKIKELFLYFSSGLFIGLSLITRTSEMVWIGVTILIILITNFKKIYWPGLIVMIVIIIGTLIPVFYYNQIIYESPLSLGYRTFRVGAGLLEIVESVGLKKLFIMFFVPFGFNLKLIIINGYNWLIAFLLYWSMPTIFGLIIFLFIPGKFLGISWKKKVSYICYLLFANCYLLIFYGSWSIVDRLDKSTVSLGTSYLRYFLPIYLSILPFFALLIHSFVSFFKYRFLKIVITIFIILFLFIPTATLVLVKTDESLIYTKTLFEYQVKSQILEKILPEKAVVVTYKQADKILFPERKHIILKLNVPYDYISLKKLTKLVPIYYYTFAPTSTVEFISGKDFEPYGMKITEGKRVFGKEWIYKIK